MAKSYASAVIEAPAEQVWQVVRDFDGLPRWHPAITASEIEDGAAADTVGCVRHLTLADGGVVREQLVSLDDADRSYTYDIVESPFPVRSYRATIRVRPITDTGHSFVEWYAHYDADAADEDQLDRTFATDVYRTGLTALRNHLRNPNTGVWGVGDA
ncbi:polyketide cyclase [Saccharopolyspora subtropica]|uniref:Polyketide cyclase n=1 Tax=Saccharopolyspora thermophila TaxID=89367 RepID=A0A917JMV1_9PSEU|nr:SRPBCC family protein [Saccharopolyspora subtropica]GGI75987.1 polyketide cyclase [Saccharopolyspora subtropica]